MRFEEIVTRLECTQKQADGFMALCPAHDDRNPSLSVRPGGDGRTLLHCFAGCDVDSVVEALGLTTSDLFDESTLRMNRVTPRIKCRHDWRPVAEYNYSDPDGSPVQRIHRKECASCGRKIFHQEFHFEDRWFSGSGAKDRATEAGFRDADLVLFRMQELADLPDGGVVLVCEGEKACQAAVERGLNATTAPGGSNAQWHDQYTRTLSRFDVIVVPDHDRPGEEYGQQVADHLQTQVRSVKLVRLVDDWKGCPKGGDLFDWFNLGRTLDQFWKLVTRTPNYEPEDSESTFPTIPQRVYDILPPFIRSATDFFPSWERRDVFLTSLLGVLSAVMPNVRLYHGQATYSLHIFVFIIAEPASGKGAATHAFRWLDSVDDIILAESEAEHADWVQRKHTSEREARFGSGVHVQEPPGPEPEEHCLKAGANTTAAALALRLATNPEGVFIGSTEADALSSSNKREHGDFSFIMRKAFHHDDMQIDRKSERTARVKQPRLALVLTGTPRQFPRLMEGGVDDGLFSRFAVYRLYAGSKFESQRPSASDLELDKFTTKASQRVLDLWTSLRQRTSPLTFTLSEEQWRQLEDDFGELHNRVYSDQTPWVAPIVRRAAFIGFRIAALVAAWREFEKHGSLENLETLVPTRMDLEIGRLLALVYCDHAIRMAASMEGVQVHQDITKLGQNRMSARERQLFDALPQRFRTSQAETTATSCNVPRSTLFRWLEKWSAGDDGVLSKRAHGEYEKRRETIGIFETFDITTDGTEYGKSHTVPKVPEVPQFSSDPDVTTAVPVFRTGDRVRTPNGSGIVLQMFYQRATVHLDGMETASFYDPSLLEPENGADYTKNDSYSA